MTMNMLTNYPYVCYKSNIKSLSHKNMSYVSANQPTYLIRFTSLQSVPTRF